MEWLVVIIVVVLLAVVVRRIYNPGRLEHRRIEALRALHKERTVQASEDDE